MPTTNNAISLVVGLGEVGRPLLEILNRAHNVTGIDLPARDIDAPVDILHVCYPAEIDDFVGATRRYAAKYEPCYVAIHSTVPVGMTEAVQQQLSVPVVHSPVRGKHAKMVDDMLRYVKFIGASDAGAGRHVEEHLQKAGFRTRVLSSTRATELAKLTETTYFGLLIAFAQDVARMADEVQVPYEEVVSFYDEIGYLPRVRYFPGVIGGHCVMPNIELLQLRFSSQLLEAIQWSNRMRIAEGEPASVPALTK